MAINVTVYYNMSKDVNSTARPGSGNFTNMATFACSLFEPCSMVRPIMRLETPGAPLRSANYAYIAEFGRYYWINDMEFRNGYWYLYLSCDVLATYKTQIGSTTQYVLRSQSVKDENIRDTFYVPVGGRAEAFNSINSPFAANLRAGTYIIGVTSSNPNLGSTKYVAFNESQMITFLSKLMGEGDYLNLDISDLDSNTAKIILNPMQYIQSVTWFPFNVTATVTSTQLFFGWWLIDSIQFSELGTAQDLRKYVQFSIPIPKHPQASTRGAYLNLEPYSQYRLLLPVLGMIDLPAELMYDMGGIRCEYTVDLVTGRAEVDIYAYDTDPGADRERRLLHTTCEMGVSIPIAQITHDELGAAKTGVSSLVSGISSIATGGIVGGITTLVNGAIDANLKMVTPIASFMGAPGNLTSYTVSPTIINFSQEISEDANVLFGSPLCQNKVINTLSGYTMCGRAHIQIPGATRQEMDEIENFMNGGFRYE